VFFSALALVILVLRIKSLKCFFVEIISELRKSDWKQIFWLLPLLAILVLYFLLIKTVLFEASDGTLRAALVGWGDTALHLNIIERFAAAKHFVLGHPLMAGAPLTYPFLLNFISAIYRSLGASRVFAYAFPLLVSGISAIVLLFSVARRFLGSKGVAVLVLVLIIFGAGLGFITFFKDVSGFVQENGLPALGTFFINPPHEYTHLDNRTGGKPGEKDTPDNIVWMVPIISFLSHQRTFSLGLAVFCLILLGIYYYGKTNDFWRFGVFAGFLPFIHIHSFLALFLLMAVLFWFYLKNKKAWLIFAGIAVILAAPQLLYFGSANGLGNDIRLWFGWMACDHQVSWLECSPLAGTDNNVFTFWSKNFGIVFWLWLAAIAIFIVSRFWKKFNPGFKPEFLITSIILFILPNLFLFQAWPFDNNKIFFYWWILAIIFGVGPLLVYLFKKKIVGLLIIAVIVFFGTLAGAIDFSARLLYPKNYYYFGYSDSNKEKVQAGQWIKENTLPDSLFLMPALVDPLPLFLAGRPIYLGFEGWLWTEGLDISQHHSNMVKMFGGDLDLACREKIDYIILDDDSRKDFPGSDNILTSNRIKVVFVQETPMGPRKILKVICP
ncbi:MAG: hypothetical protein Q8N56_04495, partial [bacterium]|nr:hypothetical protein [bacterium]